jgi:Tfp pilus assembly protein FimT
MTKKVRLTEWHKRVSFVLRSIQSFLRHSYFVIRHSLILCDMNRSRRKAKLIATSGILSGEGPRAGYTLLELLLVVGILMICAGAVAPSVMGMLANYQLKDGVRKVQTALAATRVHAVDATSIYEFRFEPGGRHFAGVPTDNDVLNAAGSSGGQNATPLGAGLFVSGVLPENLSFQVSAPSGPAAETPSMPAASDPGWTAGLGRMPDAHDFASVAWSEPIYFRPDGTASDTTFTIVDSRGSGYRLTIREVTGEIFVHSIDTEPR